jgi:DinB superfamily
MGVDAQRFFLEQHQITAGVVEQFVLGGVADNDLRRSPSGEQNPLAWLLWHAARWEDVIVNAWILRRDQVFDSQGWSSRLGAGTRHVGTGMTSAEVNELASQVDLDELRRYWRATAAATADGIGELADTVLGDTVAVEQLEVGAVDGAFHNERAGWMDQFWADHTVSWFLAFLNLHAAEHLLGEALVTRSQLGIPLGL